MPYIGEFAALGTSLAYAFGSTLFTLAGRNIGSDLVNRIRLLFAVILVLIWHWLWLGIPVNAGTEPIVWLAISGFIGFMIGDALLFKGFVILGPRIAMVIFSLNPAMGAILAWMFLGENLLWQQWAGILLTLLGIAIVVAEPKPKAKNDEEAAEGAASPLSQREYIIGILFALGGALGQAVGQIFSKMGLDGGNLEPLSAHLIRLAAALIAIWFVAAFQKQIKSSAQAMYANPKSMILLLLAAIAGPVLGVWLNLEAIDRIELGVASTLGSLTPIFLIPISYFFFKEKISAYAIVGTIVAFVGTVVLFF